MSEKDILTIDYSQKDAMSKLAPRPPLLCSREAGWKHIILERYIQPAHEVPEYRTDKHMLIIHLNSITGSERKIDGKHQDENPQAGDVAIVPANNPHWTVDVEEEEGFLLLLEPQFLSQVAYEFIDPDRVELLPRFAQYDPLLHGIGLALETELRSGATNSTLYVESLCNTLAMYLLRHCTSRQFQFSHHSYPLSRQKLNLVIDYINDNLDRDLRLAAIANLLDLSQYHFCRLFKRSTGIAFHQYVLRQRVNKAKQLLKTTQLSIAEIAHRVGFSDQSQLTVQFRKVTGVTPGKYRDRTLNQ
jgi:AraC family transcriptional regulator